jgi:hypothetical protein
MSKTWTPEERAAFGAKMAAARAAKADATSAQEAQPDMTEQKEYAKPGDIPGARPIAAVKKGQTLEASAVTGLVEAPDTTPTAGVVEAHGTVIGGPSTAAAARPSSMKSGMVVADRPLQAGDNVPLPNQSRGFGPADPTGLPCTCEIGTSWLGRPRDETWCIVCGGEIDKVSRPENALRGRHQFTALKTGVALTEGDIDAIAQRTAAILRGE